jgi:hypothetical protein
MPACIAQRNDGPGSNWPFKRVSFLRKCQYFRKLATIHVSDATATTPTKQTIAAIMMLSERQ